MFRFRQTFLLGAWQARCFDYVGRVLIEEEQLEVGSMIARAAVEVAAGAQAVSWVLVFR